MDIRVLANNQVFSKVLTQDQQRPPTVWLVTRGSVEERIMQCLEMTDDARRNKRTWREVWEISERCRNAVRQANEWPPISDFDPLITASAENLAKRLLPVQRVPEVQFRIEQASEPVHAISHEQQPTLSVPSSPDSQASESSYSTLASTSQQPVQFEKSLKRKPAEAFDSMQEAAESQPNQKALANRKKKLRQFIASVCTITWDLLLWLANKSRKTKSYFVNLSPTKSYLYYYPPTKKQQQTICLTTIRYSKVLKS